MVGHNRPSGQEGLVRGGIRMISGFWRSRPGQYKSQGHTLQFPVNCPTNNTEKIVPHLIGPSKERYKSKR